MIPITVTIAPERGRVRMLARSGEHDLLKAVLGPADASHPRAAATLLEGLALWHQQRLAVVLCADDESAGCALDLCDALGFGRSTLHFDVGLAFRPRRPRARRLSGLGDFRDLRQLSLVDARGEELAR